MASRDALLEDVKSGDLAARVINTPTALFSPLIGRLAPDTWQRINDDLAVLTAEHPGRLHALASVDAFAGDSAARELVRAVRDLGLRGVFVESAKGSSLLDAPEARPTLQVAAELGVPVFAHPINPRPLSRQLAPYGRLGTLLRVNGQCRHFDSPPGRRGVRRIAEASGRGYDFGDRWRASGRRVRRRVRRAHGRR